MKTKVWLVRAASLAVVGTLTVGAWAQKPHRKKGAAPAPAAPATPPGPPPATTTPEKEEDGPFAPQGNQGKLREEGKSDDEGKDKPAAPPPPAPQKPGSAGADLVFGFGKTGGTTGPDAVEITVVSLFLGGPHQGRTDLRV